MTAPMSSGHRLALLNLLHDTDHLVWLHRSAINQGENAYSSSEHLRLIDHASRAAALARGLIDGDNGSRDVGAGFKPSPSALRDRLRAHLATRRRRRDEPDAEAAPESSTGMPIDDGRNRKNEPAFDPGWRDAEPDFDQEHGRLGEPGGAGRPRMRPR